MSKEKENLTKRTQYYWEPKENYAIPGTEVIAHIKSDKGFKDITAKLFYLGGRFDRQEAFGPAGWYWADTEDYVKRPDLIVGVVPWPEPPTEEKTTNAHQSGEQNDKRTR